MYYSNLKDSSLPQKMVLHRKHFHAIIFYNFRRGLIQPQCIDELNSNFGDEFREGRTKSVVVVVAETIDYENGNGVHRLTLEFCSF